MSIENVKLGDLSNDESPLVDESGEKITDMGNPPAIEHDEDVIVEEEEEEDNQKNPEEDDADGEDSEGEEGDSEDEGEDGKAEAEDFYNTVKGITGLDFEVDFGEVDPLSPEGVAKRDLVIHETAMSEYDTLLADKYPRAYALMLHLAEGGTEKDFFEKSGGYNSLPSKEVIESSLDAQKNLVFSDLIEKGVDPATAQSSVDARIKDGSLSSRSLEIFNEKEQRHRSQLESIKNERIQREQRETQLFNDTLTAIDQASDNLTYKIPQAKKEAFLTEVKKNIVKMGDGYAIVQPLSSPEEIKKALESSLFKFNGSTLKDLVEVEARNKATQRLRKTLNNDKNKKSSSTVGTRKPGFVPLGSLGE